MNHSCLNILLENDGVLFMNKHRLMNGYRFEYKKYDNQIFNDRNSKSIIEVILYDNLDVPIYKFRISELDCIRIIDNLTQYLYNLYKHLPTQ